MCQDCQAVWPELINRLCNLFDMSICEDKKYIIASVCFITEKRRLSDIPQDEFANVKNIRVTQMEQNLEVWQKWDLDSVVRAKLTKYGFNKFYAKQVELNHSSTKIFVPASWQLQYQTVSKWPFLVQVKKPFKDAWQISFPGFPYKRFTGKEQCHFQVSIDQFIYFLGQCKDWYLISHGQKLRQIDAIAFSQIYKQVHQIDLAFTFKASNPEYFLYFQDPPPNMREYQTSGGRFCYKGKFQNFVFKMYNNLAHLAKRCGIATRLPKTRQNYEKQIKKWQNYFNLLPKWHQGARFQVTFTSNQQTKDDPRKFFRQSLSNLCKLKRGYVNLLMVKQRHHYIQEVRENLKDLKYLLTLLPPRMSASHYYKTAMAKAQMKFGYWTLGGQQYCKQSLDKLQQDVEKYRNKKTMNLITKSSTSFECPAGFPNLGTTCFMGALFEILVIHFESKNDTCFAELFNNSLQEPLKWIKEMKEYIDEISQSFRLGQHDVHELFVFLVQKIERTWQQKTLIITTAILTCSCPPSIISENNSTLMLIPEQKPVQTLIQNYSKASCTGKCPKCQNNKNMTTKIVEHGEIVAIYFKTTQQGKSFQKIVVQQQIQLIQSKKLGLIGVICHIGPSAHQGHYIAYTKIGDKWFQCNGSKITKKKFAKFNGEVCMLFYKVKKQSSNMDVQIEGKIGMDVQMMEEERKKQQKKTKGRPVKKYNLRSK